MKAGADKGLWLPCSLLAAGLLYFLMFFLLSLNIPCLAMDETVVGIVSWCLLRLKEPFVHHTGSVPLAYSEYTGFFKSYTGLPFMLFFGPKVWVVRIQYLFWGMGGLWAMFFVLRRFFGLWAAALAAFLLATDTYFIRSAVSGVIRDEVLMNAMFWISMACLLRAWDAKERAGAWLFAAGFIMGLGLWAKLIFAGYFLGFAGCVLVLRRETLRLVSGGLFATLRRRVVFGFGLALGAAPLALFNVLYGFPALRLVFRLFAGGGGEGWDNSRLFHNLAVRVCNLFSCVAGRQVPSSVDVYALFPPAPDVAGALVFVLALFWLSARLVRGGGADAPVRREALRAGLAMGCVLLAGTCMVPSGYVPDHVLIVLPAARILVAIFAAALFSGGGLTRRAAVVALVSASVLMQVFNMAYFLRVAYRDDGMNDYFYPRQREIADTLKELDTRVLLDMTDHLSASWIFLLLGHPKSKQVEAYMHFISDNPDLPPGRVLECFYNRYAAHLPRYLYLEQLRHNSRGFFTGFPLDISSVIRADGGQVRLVRIFGCPHDRQPFFRLYEVSSPKAVEP